MFEDILTFVVEAIFVLLAVGLFIISYEQIRFFVVAIIRIIKEHKENKDKSNQ